MRFALVAHRGSPTNDGLVAAALRVGLDAARLTPREALRMLEPGDVALARLDVRETLDGVRLWQGIALTTTWTLRNFWSFYFEVNLRGRYSDDREMGDGSALQFPASGGAIATLSTDPRRRVTLGWSGIA